MDIKVTTEKVGRETIVRAGGARATVPDGIAYETAGQIARDISRAFSVRAGDVYRQITETMETGEAIQREHDHHVASPPNRPYTEGEIMDLIPS